MLKEEENIPAYLQDFFVKEGELAAAKEKYCTTLQAKILGESSTHLDIQKEFLVFVVAEQEYLISIQELQEVTRIPELTPVPLTLPYVLGVFSLRGTIIPVVSLPLLLGFKVPCIANGDLREKEQRILILKGDNYPELNPNLEPLGLLVDRVSKIISLTADKQITNAPANSQKFLDKIVRVEQQLFVTLNMRELAKLLGIMAKSHEKQG